MSNEQLTFPALTATLKAAGEATRLRILVLLAEAELTVSDLTEILRQSQPRLSRHLRLLAEAGLVERFREGSWAFLRLGERGGLADIARALIGRLDPNDPIIARDHERLAAVRTTRAAAAQNYFRRHAAEWDRIRKLHVADAAVEDAIRMVLTDKPIRALLDLGTGTGRMLELFAGDIERGLGLDLSLDMLALARTRLDRAGLKHCSVRQGDIYDLALPRDSFDLVIVHQVLHFLDDSPAPSPRRRACCARADVSSSSTSHRTISSFCATSMPIAGSVLPPRPCRNGWKPPVSTFCASKHSRPDRRAISPCRCGWRATRASCSPSRQRARWRNERAPRQPFR
jgi:DNA-binding transcriptional ArsR family regulator